MSAKVPRGSAFLLAVIPALFGAGLGAQESTRQLEFEYSAARSSYVGAVAAWSAQEEAYQNALARWAEAKRAGDDGAEEAAFAQFYFQSQELLDRKRRVEDTAGTLDEARRAFLGGLDDRRESLEARLDSATSQAERTGILALLGDLENQYHEIEAAASQPSEETLVYFANAQLDPRDGPLEWRFKAELLERKVTDAEQRLRDLDDEIERLASRLRLRRTSESFSAGLDRFGATRLPTGVSPTGPPREGQVVPDTTLALSAMPLDQRIETLQATRAQLEGQIEQLRRRASVFRDLLAGMR